MKNLTKLKEPIRPHEIHWRVQSKGNGKTTVVPYLTNRCVMERFDEQFGATEWQNVFCEWRSKGVKCGISVRVGEEWVTKYDGADETNIEATKGGFSDSMKRAAVQWGLGRDLYDYPLIQLEGEHKYLSRIHEAQLNDVAAKISGGQKVGDYILLDGKTMPKPSKVVVKEDSKEFLAIVDWIINGKDNKEGDIVKGNIEWAKQHYSISDEVEASLKEKIVALQEIV